MRYFFSLMLVLGSFSLYSQDKEYQSLILDPSLTAKANALVREDHMKVELNSVTDMEITRHRVVTVFNKFGNEHSRAYVGYNNGLKIKKLYAVVYDALGKEIERFKEKDFKDISAVSQGTLYSDSRIKYLDYTPVQFPYTFELHYETSSKNTGIVPSWYFQDDYLLGVEKSLYEVIYSTPDLLPDIKEVNLDSLQLDRLEETGRIQFTASRIPAVKQEELSPPFREMAPQLKVRLRKFHYEGYHAEVDSWEDVGRWMHSNLLTGRDKLPEGVVQKARMLVSGVEDDLEKARIIYQYLQDNTRYISVQVGIGGIQPISAIEVDRVKYGDCKGLSNYTKALLAAVGVDSYYCHVEAGRHKDSFLEDFADLKQGNHVILAIPYKYEIYWIDCTSQIHPFGYLGSFTDDRKVLMITDKGGKIAHTPAYVNEMNHQKTLARVALNARGDLEGKVDIITSGIQYEQHFQLQREADDKLTEHYRNYWKHLTDLTIHSHNFKDNQREVRFSETLDLSSGRYAAANGGLMLFAPNAFNRNTYVPDRYRNRKLPFQVSRGFLDEDEFEISLPEGYRVDAIPDVANLESAFGTYAVTLQYDEPSHKLKYSRKLLLKDGHYGPSEYENYRDFRRKIASIDQMKVVLAKITP